MVLILSSIKKAWSGTQDKDFFLSSCKLLSHNMEPTKKGKRLHLPREKLITSCLKFLAWRSVEAKETCRSSESATQRDSWQKEHKNSQGGRRLPTRDRSRCADFAAPQDTSCSSKERFALKGHREERFIFKSFQSLSASGTQSFLYLKQQQKLEQYAKKKNLTLLVPYFIERA